MKFEGSYYNDSNSNNNNNNHNNNNSNKNISNNNTITTSRNETSSQENAIDVAATAADTGIATEINKNTYSNDKSSKLFKYSKSSSFCLKAFLEKTKSKVLNSNSTSTSNSISSLNNCTNNCCQQQHRLLTRTNRSSLKMLNHHNLHHHHKINIIKPIALRPNQAEMLKPNATLSYLNDLNSNYRFASIDSINSSSSSSPNSFSNCQRFALKSPQASMQRRNTMPRVNFKNISFTAYVTNASNTNMNQCQPQRPQLNFIKMKLQRYLNENCNDCVLDASSDLFKMKKFDILSLATLNLNGKSTTTTTNSTYQETPITCIMNLDDNIINNYKYVSSNTNINVNMNVNSNYNSNNNNDNIRNSLSASSSVSSLSSSLSNQNTFQMCLSSSNESDLDIAQIENDLNF